MGRNVMFRNPREIVKSEQKRIIKAHANTDSEVRHGEEQLQLFEKVVEH